MQNIYLLYGEEEFLIGEKLKEIKSRFSNVEILDSDNITPEALCSALQTPVLWGGDKLVILRDIQDQELCLPALKNLPPGVTVVLQAAAVDQRSKLYRFISEAGEVLECRSFAPWEQEAVVNWIKMQVGQGGKKIADRTARTWQEISGNNLRLLSSDIEKTITYLGEREEISEQDVLAMASPGQKNIFDLLDALRKKNLQRSLVVFQALLKNKEDLFQLLSTLASQYRLMLQIKGMNDPRRIKGSPFFIKKCSENIGRFKLDELKAKLGLILETSLKLKTGEYQPLTFELLLASLCGN